MKIFSAMIATAALLFGFATTVSAGCATGIGNQCPSTVEYKETGGLTQSLGKARTWGVGRNAGTGNVLERRNTVSGLSITENTGEYTVGNCAEGGCPGFNTRSTGYGFAGQEASSHLVVEGDSAEGITAADSVLDLRGTSTAYRIRGRTTPNPNP